MTLKEWLRAPPVVFVLMTELAMPVALESWQCWMADRPEFDSIRAASA